ncbi:MAG: Uma2 family endonuclease [Defluviitaleaceae bacterium]|nr:Uma2 family endonuclease [Defluviitaleaceae bacterium]
MQGAINSKISLFSSLPRHGRLVSGFSGEIDFRYREEIRSFSISKFSEQYALACFSDHRFSLIAAETFTGTKAEREGLNYVQPDFMLFRNNPFFEIEGELRMIGCPDFIVEVWSKGNDKEHRQFKQSLYSTSDVTEHWYLTQTSNKVERYKGAKKLPNTSLKKIMETECGLTFDLTYLAR